MPIEPLVGRGQRQGMLVLLAWSRAGLNMRLRGERATLAAVLQPRNTKDAMLGLLFRTLTAEPARGALLFGAASAKARETHWYVAGAVPDTIDGRFAVLSTVVALILVRLEQDGAAGERLSVALAERFIEVMESEHRELGIGDPTLGKTVRKLVGSLARRTKLWRDTVAAKCSFANSARQSLYRGGGSAGLDHSVRALESLWHGLRDTALESLEQGRIG